MTYTPGHISTLPSHDGDGYGYGADVIVSFGERAINLGPSYREGTMDLARLIAAAPDLLWLAQNRQRYKRINTKRDDGETVASFEKEFVASYDHREHDAIAKATGKD